MSRLSNLWWKENLILNTMYNDLIIHCAFLLFKFSLRESMEIKE